MLDALAVSTELQLKGSVIDLNQARALMNEIVSKLWSRAQNLLLPLSRPEKWRVWWIQSAQMLNFVGP
ncbi:hypothetical protein BH10PLA2_BH10PLA2_07150 [soil metagenome]